MIQTRIVWVQGTYADHKTPAPTKVLAWVPNEEKLASLLLRKREREGVTAENTHPWGKNRCTAVANLINNLRSSFTTLES